MLTNNNISFNVDTVKECLEEIKPTETREELLAHLTYDKLKMYNDSYMVKFNKIVDDLYDCAVSSNFKGMSMLMNRLSKVSHSVFNAELDTYKRLVRYANDNEKRDV